jgi:pyrroloquinoline quinone (PQQ) biosynthesis protein C
VGEESDVDGEGIRKSHFELYLQAMQQCGANVEQMQLFISTLQNSGDFKEAYAKAQTPEAAKNFVNFTFDCISTQKPHLQAAVFTFGREDLIPAMFHSIVSDMHQKFPDALSVFKYYLERHIEVDGDHHSNLALAMTSNLCGDNELFWEEATEASIKSLQSRIALWDGIYEIIIQKKELVSSI